MSTKAASAAFVLLSRSESSSNTPMRFELLAMACLGAAWLVPNHYPPWMSFYNESCAAIGLGLLVLALGRRNVAQPVPAAVGWLMALAGVPWLQWAFGRLAFSGDAVVVSAYLVGTAAAVAAGHAWGVADRRSAVTMLAATMLLGALTSALLALAQALGVADLGLWAEEIPSRDGRAGANLGQPNNLATLIGFGMLGLLCLRETTRLSVLTSVLIALVLLLGVTVTQSRTALLFGPVIVAGWWLARRRGILLRTRVTTLLVGVGLQWLLAAGWPALKVAIEFGPPNDAVTRLGAGGGSRLPMWEMLANAVALSPWWGYGVLQVGEAQLAVSRLHPPAPEFWMHAHNLVLDAVLWFGIPLGLLVAGVAAWWSIRRVRGVANAEGLIGVLVIAVFAVHAMLELPHHYLYLLIPTGLWAGLAHAAERARVGPVSPGWSLVPAAVGLLLGIGIGHRYLAVEEDFRQVRFENRRIGSASTELPAHAPFLSSLTAFVKFSRIEPRAGMTGAELDFVASVARRYPYSASLYRWARALALNGRLAEAAEVIDALLRMHGAGNLLLVHRNLEELIVEGRTDLVPLERLARSMLPPAAARAN